MASINFINECKKAAYKNRLGTLVIEGIENPITNSDKLQSFTIDSGCYIDGNIIGNVYIKCLTSNLVDISEEINLVDKTIDVQVGVKYEDDTTEFINLGRYIVERPKDEKQINFSSITAYDSLIEKIDSPYVCGIDFSEGNKTVADLYVDLCNNLGLTPKTTTFLNNDIPVEGNPFTNKETNRIVLQTIAKVSCSFVVIDNDTNEIDLCWLSDSEEPDYIFEQSDYSTLEGGTIVYGPVNSVTIKNSQIDDENVTQTDDDSIIEHGEHSVVINEDYILYNATLRQQAITAIFNRLNGLKYIDCKLTTLKGKPFLNIGDKIRIYTDNDKYFDTYVLNHKFTYDGAFTSIIESPALTKTEIKTKQSVDLKEALKNTQIEINKAKGTITETIEMINETNSQITQVEQDINGIRANITRINDVEEKINEIETTVSGMQQSITYSGGYNLLENCVKQFGQAGWTGTFNNVTNTEIQRNSLTKSALEFMNDTEEREIQVPNGIYNFSCKYKKLVELANCKVIINNNEILLEDTEWTEIEYTFEVTANTIIVKFESDTDYSCWLVDLLFIPGDIKQTWTPNPNEINTGTIKLGGDTLSIEANYAKTKFEAKTDGIRIKNTDTNEVTTEYTDKGTKTKKIEANEGEVAKLLMVDMGNQTWISRM